MMSKAEMRRRYLEAVWGLDPDYRSQASERITQRLYATGFDQFRHGHFISCYVSLDNEVSTLGLIERMLGEGKVVAVPKVKNRNRMEMHIINATDELVPGFKGIPEPMEGSEPIHPRALDVIIVPAVAWFPGDKDENSEGIARLGRGGGCYDRYLQKATNALKIGLGFDVQVSEEPIPTDDHDYPVKVLITEKRIF